MQDSTRELRIMRRRGRPRKSSSDNSPIRKTRTLRLTEEEVRHITENARRCRKNFSEYCRQVLMGYKPGVYHRDGEIDTFLSILMMLKPTAESLDSCLIPAPFCKTEMRILSLDRGDGLNDHFLL